LKSQWIVWWLNCALDPLLILRTDLARKGMNAIRRCYPATVQNAFERIEECPGLIEVVHWSTNNRLTDWDDQIRTKLLEQQGLGEEVAANLRLRF
jgi:hypothetical protein